MIMCTILCDECALISDRHVQSSSSWGVQYITTRMVSTYAFNLSPKDA